MAALADLERVRTRVSVGKKAPSHTNAYESVHTFSGRDNSFDLKKFKKDLKINIISSDDEAMVFDLIGVDTAFANALRRILIAEVPTMAIDKVKLFQNTSILQDEVLCHRLGLLPVKVDPRLFSYHEDGKPASEKNTLVFTLDVKCTRKAQGADLPLDETYDNHTIYSKAMAWVPQGKQASVLAEAPRMVHDDIIIAKMRPGQAIEAECHVKKGIGSLHTKWSPVCTASYRLMPEVIIKEEITGEEAEKLVKTCPMGVFDIEDIGGKQKAVVGTARNCSMCRECIRDPEMNDKIELTRVRDHFVFSIESTGVYTPGELFKEAIKVLSDKCDNVIKELS